MPCRVMPPRYYLYIVPVMLHEFGHTAGLGHANNNDALIHRGYNNNVLDIRPHDESGLEAPYSGHSH